MPLVLSPAEASDLPRIVDLEAEIFASWSGYEALGLGASLPRKMVAQARYLHHLLNDPTAHLVKVTDASTGLVVGSGLWNVYNEGRTAEDIERNYHWDYSPDVKSFREVLEYNNLVNETRIRVMGSKPHSLLRWLVVDPAYRRRGVGSQILEYGVKEADRHGIPCMLEASDMGKLVYVQHGFEIIEEIWTPMMDSKGEPVHGGTVMVRPAKALKV